MTIPEAPSDAPNLIAVHGGGRWARVIAKALLPLMPPNGMIRLHSPSNHAGLIDWCSRERLGPMISISAIAPTETDDRPTAIVLANAAHHHFEAARAAIAAGIPVLVEKPFALSEANARQLIAAARERQCGLLAAHVFFFARYLHTFRSLIPSSAELREIRIVWENARTEQRYGEAVSYDAGVSVVDDVMPHVISVLMVVLGQSQSLVENVAVGRGGAEVEITALWAKLRCKVRLGRNSEIRRRLIEVETSQGVYSLGFAKEPGVIVTPTSRVSGDPAWEPDAGPLVKLLTSFLGSTMHREPDARLDPAIGLTIAAICDRIRPRYLAAREEWLSRRSAERADEDIVYALKEIGGISHDLVEKSAALVVGEIWNSAVQRQRLAMIVDPASLRARIAAEMTTEREV